MHRKILCTSTSGGIYGFCKIKIKDRNKHITSKKSKESFQIKGNAWEKMRKN